MNDFTKEELEDLLFAIALQDNEDFSRKSILIKKLKELINNYCKTNGHDYDYSLGRGHCLNCDELE